MYNLIQYSSNYSETTRSLWFYSKDEAPNFNADIGNNNNNNFNSFKYKAKLLGTTVTQATLNEADGILKNATFAAPLKFLSSFWRLLEMTLINCKVELKRKWTKYCVLSGAGHDNDNDNDNSDNGKKNIFTIKDTKLYDPFVTLTARDNQKLSKLLSK